MTARRIEIAQRRQMLISRAVTQRAELAKLTEYWREPLALADGAYRLGKILRRRPAIAIATVAILARMKSQRILALSGYLLTLWQLYRAWRGRTQEKAGHVSP
ncbi:MAG: YqjK family protein [Acidiferrobacterales bacterium]